MRQPNQHEQYRTDEKEGGKQSEVAKGNGLQRHKGKEGTYGRDVANEKRLRYLSKCLPRVGLVLDMTDKMQRIVHGNADDDARYAYDNHRDAVMHQCHTCKCKEPSPKDSQCDEHDVL